MNCPACGYYNPTGSLTCFHCALALPTPAAGDARCAVHADVQATGACSRCGTFGCGACLTQHEAQWLCLPCLERELRLPWDDRLDLGVVRAWWRTSLRMMASPAKTLAHAGRPDTIGGSALYALFSTLVASGPTWFLCLGGSMVVTLMTRARLSDGAPPTLNTLIGFAVMTVASLVLVTGSELVFLGLEHVVLVLSGSKPRSFSTTCRAHALSLSPYLLGLFPFCGAVVSQLWVLGLRVATLRALHGVSTARAVGAALLPPLVVFGGPALWFLI